MRAAGSAAHRQTMRLAPQQTTHQIPMLFLLHRLPMFSRIRILQRAPVLLWGHRLPRCLHRLPMLSRMPILQRMPMLEWLPLLYGAVGCPRIGSAEGKPDAASEPDAKSKTRSVSEAAASRFTLNKQMDCCPSTSASLRLPVPGMLQANIAVEPMLGATVPHDESN